MTLSRWMCFAFVVTGCSAGGADPPVGEATEGLAALSMDEVLRDAHAAGVPCGNALVMAGAIAHAESDLVPNAINYNGASGDCPNGSRDRGIWQINDCYHSEWSDACTFDPKCNARAMATISVNGSQWWQWATYTENLYQPYLDEARAAEARVCGGSGGGGSGCPYGDGMYCGGNGVSGNSATLYHCSGGSLSVVAICAAGCEHRPNPEDDACAPCPNGDGLYCGGNGINGNSTVLYRCANGARTIAQRCSAGCARMPARTNDRCN